MSAAIEATGLGKRYDGAWVLSDISASVPRAQVVGLLGHNGAGKTTLLKLVLGLLRPTTGEVRVFGRSVNAETRREIHQSIGYLPENVAFYNNLTARETIAYLARLKRRPVAEGLSLLDQVGLANAIDRRVHTFSKGMRQRLGLAQALLGSPGLLLLDEPTAGLDPLAILSFLELVRDLRAQGKTIVISSHLLAELQPHLDRAVVLSRGRIVAQGTLADMRKMADLPVIVRVRVAHGFTGLSNQLPVAQALKRNACGDSEVELEVSEASKLQLLRRLVQLPELADISVKEPSLPEIYAQISSGAGPADEGRDA